LQKLYLLIDQNFQSKISVPIQSEQSFVFSTHSMTNGDHQIVLLGVCKDQSYIFSNTLSLDIQNPFILKKEVIRRPADLEIKQTAGIYGNVEPPLNWPNTLTWQKVQIFTQDTNVQLKLYMDEISQIWLPYNHFDHVFFYIFLAFPKINPQPRPLPCLNYDGFGLDWDIGVVLYGWGKKVFSATGSSVNAYGNPLQGHLAHAVNLEDKTITITLSKDLWEDLNVQDLSGLKILITTWDGDGLKGLRGLSQERKPYEFYTNETDPERMAQIPKIYAWQLIELTEEMEEK